MKRFHLILVFVLIFSLFSPDVIHANMAAPDESDVGSSITFERNDVISVLSEVLDITVHGSTADIFATYKMQNTTDENITTPSMFLSPNIENSGIKVLVNNKETSFTVDRYALNYDTEIKTEEWQYAILTNEELASRDEQQSVDAITFEMIFAPNEEYDVIISYTYRLGGYPNYDFNAKKGLIKYYLAPAALWNDFKSIEINLYLDEDMPVLTSSNLEFKEVGNRTYQYVSETLPEGNLEIVIDENWWQNIFSSLKSPYLSMSVMMFMPLILIALGVVVFVVWLIRRNRKTQ